MEITLSPARPSDVDRLDPMVAAYHAFEQIALTAERRRAALNALIAHPEFGHIYLFENAGEIAGYGVLTFGFSIELGGRDAFVDEFFVDPSHRGKGVGAAALALMIEEARGAGVQALHLEIAAGNAAAKSLYRRLGFTARDRFHLMSLTL